MTAKSNIQNDMTGSTIIRLINSQQSSEDNIYSNKNTYVSEIKLLTTVNE